MVANFIQDTMDGPLGARQLWCQHRLAPTIAVRKRCNANATELCLALLRIDALHSKLKGSFAWPTTARREHLTTHLLPRLLQLRSQTRMVRGQVQLWTEPKAANETT